MAILTTKQTWRRNPEPGWTRRKDFLTQTERDNVRRAVLYLCGRYPTVESRMNVLGHPRCPREGALAAEGADVPARVYRRPRRRCARREDHDGACGPAIDVRTAAARGRL